MRGQSKAELKRKEKQEENRKDMRMLLNYDPWGKPGGGAPADDTRRKKFSDDSTAPCLTDDQRADTPEDNLHSQFGRPGAGAPLRTKSGRLRTGLRFQTNEQSNNLVEKEVRYRSGADKQEYSQELQNQMAAKTMSDKEAKMQELRREHDMMSYDDPYGRPGAGAPNRKNNAGRFPPISNNNNNNSNNNNNDIRSNNNSRRWKREETFELYDPWGKGVGKADYDKFGNAKRYKPPGEPNANRHGNKENGKPKWQDTRNSVEVTRYERNHSPMSINSGGLAGEGSAMGRYTSQSEPVRPKRSFQDDQNEIYFPFGTAGGGAPMTDRNGKVQTIRSHRDDFHSDSLKLNVDTRNSQISRSKQQTDSEPVEIYNPFGRGGCGAPLKDQNGRVRASIYGQMSQKSSADQRKRAQAQLYRGEIQKEIQEQISLDGQSVSKRKERENMLKHGGGALQMAGLGGQQRHQSMSVTASQNAGSNQGMHDANSAPPEVHRGRERMARTEDNALYNTDLEKAAKERRQYDTKHNSYNPTERFDQPRGRGGGSIVSSVGSINLRQLDESFNSRRRNSRDPPNAPRGEPQSNGRAEPHRAPEPHRESQNYGAHQQSNRSTIPNAGKPLRPNQANNYEVPMTPEIQRGNNYSIKHPWAVSVDL